MLISELGDKKILILGFGREGQDSFLFLRKKFPKKTLGVADQVKLVEFSSDARDILKNDIHVKLFLGKDYLQSIRDYEVIVKSPGIPLHTIQPFISRNQIVTSQTNIFFANCPGTIIGVTGTKGKSTTSSLIYEVLKKGGVKAYLIGNIEKPVLRFLENAKASDVYVYELSSFQLETIVRSPEIAIFLNIYPEHLDHHGSFASYMRAKANIATYQTSKDYFIFNKTNVLVQKIAAKSRAKKIEFSPRQEKGRMFVASGAPARIVGKLFKIPKETIERAIAEFKPLTHRLEFIGTWNEISFYNDSLATIPEAAIAAMEVLGPSVHTLIAGGFDRGVHFEKLGEYLVKRGIRTLILFPTTGELIWKEVVSRAKSNHVSLPKMFMVSGMEEAVKIAFRETLPGKICLLSPASSSFNLFKNYKDRGEQFKKFVQYYGEKVSS